MKFYMIMAVMFITTIVSISTKNYGSQIYAVGFGVIYYLSEILEKITKE